ncbi:MAG: hypothetical protein RBT69_06220 [Spirochaetia bacterium]|nr:hypothetical protein [Spirochaetia bacterium]
MFFLIFILFPVASVTAEPFPVQLSSACDELFEEKGDLALFTPDPDAVAASKTPVIEERLFFWYALVFSGVKKTETDKYLEKYDALARDFEDYLDKTGAEISLAHSENSSIDESYNKGNAILLFLHEKIFKKYYEMETRLDVLLDKGYFNCVSSGILYYALALRNNLDVKGIRTSDHAFCAVVIPGKTVDVETTTKYGFDPGEKKEFTDSFGKTGFIYTPPANYRDRKEISQQEFLALILQNRISGLQHKRNYMDTVPLAVDRYALLGTDKAFNEMMSEFKNHAVELGNRKEYGKAVRFLSDAYTVYGDHPVITDTAGKLFYNQIVYFLEDGQIEKAEYFRKCFSSEPLISGRILDDTARLINEKKLYLSVMKNNFTKSHEEILKYHADSLIGAKEKQEYLVYIYSREIQRLSAEEGWISALDFSASAAEETGNDPRIDKLAQTVEFNLGIIYHNKFVSLYNSGALEEALSVLEEGLAVIPYNKTLISDLDLLEKSNTKNKKQQ